MPARVLRLTSPAKSRTAKGAVHPAVKSVTSTNHKTTAIGKVGAKAVAKAKKTIAAPRKVRVVHAGIVSGYAGPSTGMTKNRSKTALNVDTWGSNPERTMTPRTMATLYPVRDKFKNQPFARGNIDAGVLNAAGDKGLIEHVSGDATDPACMLRFTKRGLNEKFVRSATPD